MINTARKLYLKFTTIYGDKFTKDYPTDEFVQMWWKNWAEGLLGVDIIHIKSAVDHCMLNLKWPPSLAEFLEICDKEAGMPSVQEAMQLAIRRDFTKPIIRIIYDKIGSWAMQHDSEIELTRKFNEHYDEEIKKFRINRQKQELIENKKEISHGSDPSRDNIRRIDMRNDKDYLLQ